jgi:cytochrome c-type biogenesis protein CcmF
VVVQPLILWLWVGGGVMALGTILSAWPGTRRRPTDPSSVALASGPGATPDPDPDPEPEPVSA